MLREGDLLAGKYRIERQLGEGGMGYVVAAVHEHLQQRVAVKFLAPMHAQNPEAAARFLREARAAVRIQSEHVARVLDVAELADGAPYMVMEFLHGSDLADELARVGTFPATVAVDYVLQACEALAEAHSIGLVHRDLKPANLFLTVRADGSPLVKVLDFGISKAVSTTSPAESAGLTSAQSILGSPTYMSPEQARTPKGVDVRTDIWSLGIILYEFLSGTVPFTGDTILSVIAASFTEQPPSVRSLRPELPAGIEAVVERCMAKSPAARYQTVAELAEALAPFAEPHSISSVNRIRGTLRFSSIPPAALGAPSRPPEPRAPDDTLPTRESPAIAVLAHDLDTLSASEPSSGAAAKSPKSETLTDWGSTSSDRSRRRVLMAGGGVALLALMLLLFLLGSNFASRADDHPSAHPPAVAERQAAAEAEPVKRTPVVAAPGPSVAPELNPLPRAASAAASESAHPAKSPASLGVRRAKAPAPAASQAQPRNPLDGRL